MPMDLYAFHVRVYDIKIDLLCTETPFGQILNAVLRLKCTRLERSLSPPIGHSFKWGFVQRRLLGES